MVGRVQQQENGNVRSFDPQGSSYAVLCADGRVKVWDCASGRVKVEYVPEDHLTNKFTCMAWPRVLQTGGGGKRKKGKKANNGSSQHSSNGCIALGTESGKVIVYNVVRGCVEAELSGAHTKKVTSLAWSNDNTSLFSSAEDKYIVHWAIEKQEELKKWKADAQPTTSLCVNKGSTMLITGGRTLKCWDLESYKQLYKYTGHSKTIKKVCFTPDEKYAVTMAEGDSYIGVWAVEDPDTSYTLTMESDIMYMDVARAATAAAAMKGTQEYKILGASATGEINVWSSSLVDVENNIEFSGSCRFFADDGSDACDLQTCVFDYASPEKKLKITRSNLVKPIFETISYVDEEGIIIEEQIFHRSGEKGMLLKQSGDDKGAKKVKTANVTISGPAEQALALPAMDKGEDVEMETADDDAEVTMGDKLADLRVGESNPAPSQASGRTPPKAESLVKMLVQALHSEDNSLLEECLNTTNENVVRNTVKRLPTQYVVPFLTQTIHKFQAKPSRGIMLVPWIKSIILIHASYLMSLPDLNKSLGGLYQLVDARLSSFKKLLKLSGRLELIMSQITTKADGADVVALEDMQEADMIYEEEDSEEEDEDADEEEMEMDEDDEEALENDVSEDDEDDDDEDDN
eukprot:Nk52_evm36s248 gene=Nk52_evmTU36s248